MVFWPRQQPAAQRGTCKKQKNHAEIALCLAHGFGVAAYRIAEQRFHTGAQITNAHGAGKAIAVHLAKRLHLHGAGKADKTVCQRVDGFGHKAHRKQDQYLRQQHPLPPVKPAFPQAHPLGGGNACRKKCKRHQIAENALRLTVDHGLRQQHNVAGLCVGKHVPPQNIGVGILQPAGKR